MFSISKKSTTLIISSVIVAIVLFAVNFFFFDVYQHIFSRFQNDFSFNSKDWKHYQNDEQGFAFYFPETCNIDYEKSGDETIIFCKGNGIGGWSISYRMSPYKSNIAMIFDKMKTSDSDNSDVGFSMIDGRIAVTLYADDLLHTNTYVQKNGILYTVRLWRGTLPSVDRLLDF